MENQRIITVFCSSSERVGDGYRTAAYQLGKLIAQREWLLKNGAGGGKSLMGAMTDGALSAGGKVQGVILDHFLDLKHDKLEWCEVFPTLFQRKEALIKGAHAIVILPGGLGTLDELGDVFSMKQTKLLAVPIVVINVKGYYTPLLSWLKTHALKLKFIKRGDLQLFDVVKTPEQAVRLLEKHFGQG